jgi:glutamate dehydrogenase
MMLSRTVLRSTFRSCSTRVNSTKAIGLDVAKRNTARRCFSNKKDPYGAAIPGLGSQYGSLGEPSSPKAAVAWQAEANIDVQRVTQNAMIYELTQEQTKTIEQVVPWFLANMPPAYFRQIPEQFRIDHIKAISAVKDANMDMYLNLKSKIHDGRQVFTFIRPGTQPGTLLSMVEELPTLDENLPLTRLHVFSSLDESLSLNMFVYGNNEIDDRSIHFQQGEVIQEFAKQVQDGLVPELEPSPLFEPDALHHYMQQCSDTYLRFERKRPIRFLRQRLMFQQVTGSENTEVRVEPALSDEDAGHFWMDMAVANSLPQVALERACRLLFLHQFDISRARLDVIQDGDNGSVTMLRLLVSPNGGGHANPSTFALLSQELKRSKWLDPATMDLVFDRYPWLGVRRGEVITAICSLLHPVLAKDNALVYSKANIVETVTKERYIDIAAKIADLFLERFDPEHPLSDQDLATRRAELTKVIDTDVEDTIASGLLLKMMDVIEQTLKTNIYMENRYALGLRLNPAIMGEPSQGEMPYGILFVHGRRFNGYHVRFRDIARGGLRLVTPATTEQYALESARQYDECYGLA